MPILSQAGLRRATGGGTVKQNIDFMGFFGEASSDACSSLAPSLPEISRGEWEDWEVRVRRFRQGSSTAAGPRAETCRREDIER